MNTAFPSLLHDSGKDEQQPVFAEPWEAYTFAIAVKLSEKGLLKWSEWSDVLAEEIKEAKDQGQPDFGNTYYQFWISALETILLEKNYSEKNRFKINDGTMAQCLPNYSARKSCEASEIQMIHKV